MFLCFDGLDGAGKSTQMQRLCAWLEARGHEVVTCRDPGSTDVGEQLRAILLDRSSLKIGRRCEMLMYMAARAQLVEEFIRPALAAGKTVISDRYLLANIVYQGYAGGLDPHAIADVGQVAVDGLLPDLTFVFDLPVATALQRLNRELDRMESQGVEFMERVRGGFLSATIWYPARSVVLDATASIESTFAIIQSQVAELLTSRE